MPVESSGRLLRSRNIGTRSPSVSPAMESPRSGSNALSSSREGASSLESVTERNRGWITKATTRAMYNFDLLVWLWLHLKGQCVGINYLRTLNLLCLGAA